MLLLLLLLLLVLLLLLLLLVLLLLLFLVFSQVLVGFRYGREDLDVLGLNCRRDLVDVRVNNNKVMLVNYCLIVLSNTVCYCSVSNTDTAFNTNIDQKRFHMCGIVGIYLKSIVEQDSVAV